MHTNKFLQRCQSAKDVIKECTVEQIIERTNKHIPFLLIDVREADEFKKGSIPNSIHISKGVLERDIETVTNDPNTPIVLYCGGGYRSAIAAESLQMMGYTSVESMDGGFRSWSMLGHPVKID